MADLVLGLAKSAVEGMLTAAKSAIEEEEKLKKGMQRDLMLIADEFEMMNSFLNVAKERATDEMVRTLVRQVRNMALEVEDCIESAVLVDLKKSNWWRRLLRSRCMLAAGAAAPLDDAVAAIELLKSRVEAMAQRNERYMSIVRCSGSSSKPTEKTHRQAITDDAGVISVWGATGDLGVASIIKKTFDDPEVCKNFRFRAWVKLTHPFNSDEFIRSLLLQFYRNYCAQKGSTSAIDFLKPAEVMTATQGVLIEEFMKHVSDQRYLVLPDNKNGSWVVVPTKQLEVARLCVPQAQEFSADNSDGIVFNEDEKDETEDEDDEMVKKQEAANEWLREHGSKLVGRRAERDYLGSNSAGVWSVFGMAGVGKSYIVKHVYNKQLSSKDRGFKKDFSSRLLLDLHSGSLQHGSMLRIRDPSQECSRLLKDEPYLIVIDGLQSMEEWDSIKTALTIEVNQDRSRIIVIANEESVAVTP
ncbi:hypothetical protein U9M48_001778 [Paspalum notatum var. saurae]|uniref:Rx N-terminal domain-containing protein n=1 Tax=Paspalum notatum var. saurae TaxID=547442 RepID=A0AAQ3SIK0_PASNO